jgi:branched-chain amino acid transport system substrate-binding protein
VGTFSSVAPVSESDFTSYLRQMPDDLDLLASIGHRPGAATVVSQSFEIGLDPANILGALVPDTWWWDSIGENSTEGLLEMRGFDPESSEYREVATAYWEENEEYFDSFHANGYVAIDVLTQAMENAGSADPVAIRDALAGNSYETMYVWDLDWTDFGEHTRWTQAVIEYEPGSYEAFPEGSFHPVTLEIPEPVNPSEIENYGG